jgi:patatin-like phospholipase/acyl hydrolase
MLPLHLSPFLDWCGNNNTLQSDMSSYRIISLDGGGIRGVYSARILQRLEAEASLPLDQVHLLAGTSTGGILALGLASGLTPADMIAFYQSQGPGIFDDSWWDNIRDLGSILGSDYSNVHLRKALQATFGDKCLDDLAPKRVLIPSFDLDNSDAPDGGPAEPPHWKAKFFHNYPGPDSDGKQSIVDVAMRSSAAPTYFPTYQGYIDGGVVANNPAMAALAEAIHEDSGNQKLEDLRLLSIGTGHNADRVKGKELDWGAAQWVRPIIELMMDGGVGLADYQCHALLGANYCRINTWLELPRIGLDQVKEIPRLLKEADNTDLTCAIAWVRKQFA